MAEELPAFMFREHWVWAPVVIALVFEHEGLLLALGALIFPRGVRGHLSLPEPQGIMSDIYIGPEVDYNFRAAFSWIDHYRHLHEFDGVMPEALE